MTKRTLEELKDAVNSAINSNDAASLMECADELDALATSEAEAVAHNARGVGFYVRGNYAAALEHWHRAMAMHEELGNRSDVARVTLNIGNVHSSTGNYAAALEHYHRALAVFEEIGNRTGVASVTLNIGNVHFSTGNYPSALENYHRALAMFEELGNSSKVARLTGNIGNVHYTTGNYPSALESYHRALAMHEELCESGSVAATTGSIGVMHSSTGNHAAALEHLYRALAMHEELGESRSVALVTGNIISAMFESGEHAEAEALLQTMDIMQINEPEIVVQREHHRALLQEHHGNIDEARTTLRAALLIAQEHMLAAKQAGVRKTLRDLALKQNDLAGYVEHNNEYTRINEEINGKESTLKMAMQDKQREIDAKDREHAQHMAVLHSTLPKHVAERVARGEVVNDHFDNASVIFLDIVGFTELSSTMSSQDVITLLDNIFTQCDAICEKHDVTKIKTIGDSYMCVSFDNVVNAARCALDFLHIAPTSHPVHFRIGIHIGPLTAGVIGTQRMQYDVWGDSVNVASRMESTSEAGRVHVSEVFASNLKSNQESIIKNPISESHEIPLVTSHSSLVTSSESLVTIERGSFDIKGKGMMKTYWLENRTT